MRQEVISAEARDIMIGFADQTGLSTSRNPARRFLWTDAHAVCNFLSLYRRTGEAHYKNLALSLIDQVHIILGKHRDDDSRSGWISGLGDEEGSDHPTAGGLRIGKKLNERGYDDVFDERLEWNRDGQYFHYLTKWMHALCRTGAITGESRFCRWAVELAKVAHARFATANPTSAGKMTLFWKMRIDLSAPLVPSTGLHDPLDAHITYSELSACAEKFPEDRRLPALDVEIAETAAMIEDQQWHTDDPLGLGGLLFDAGRVFQLIDAGYPTNPGIAEALVHAATESLMSIVHHMPSSDPAEQRLAFRELGLSIGLGAVTTLRGIISNHPGLFSDRLQQEVKDLREYRILGEAIERFWSQRENQQVSTWLDHVDISRVMLATSLLPDEFLKV